MMEPWYIYIVYFVASLIFVSSILNILQRCIIPICCSSPEGTFQNAQNNQQERSVRISVIEPPPYRTPAAPDFYSLEELPPPRYEDAIKMPVVTDYKN